MGKKIDRPKYTKKGGNNLSLSDKPHEQVGKTYMGIDQGPIMVMIENHRSGLLWNYFIKSKDVLQGFNCMGFRRLAKRLTWIS